MKGVLSFIFSAITASAANVGYGFRYVSKAHNMKETGTITRSVLHSNIILQFAQSTQVSFAPFASTSFDVILICDERETLTYERSELSSGRFSRRDISSSHSSDEKRTENLPGGVVHLAVLGASRSTACFSMPSVH